MMVFGTWVSLEKMYLWSVLLGLAWTAQVFPTYSDENPMIKLADYDAVDAAVKAQEIRNLATRIMGFAEQVLSFYANNFELAMRRNPAQKYDDGRNLSHLETPSRMVHYIHAMSTILKDGSVPKVDLLFWLLRWQTVHMPPVILLGKAYSWTADFHIDVYAKASQFTSQAEGEAFFKNLVKTAYARVSTILAMASATPDNQFGLQNCNLILSLTRLLYLSGITGGSFVPTQPNFAQLMETVSASLYYQKSIMETQKDFVPPESYQPSWFGRFALLKDIAASILPLLLRFEPVPAPIRPMLAVVCLYEPDVSCFWREAVGKYRALQIDEYFNYELSILESVKQRLSLELKAFQREIEEAQPKSKERFKRQKGKSRKPKKVADEIEEDVEAIYEYNDGDASSTTLPVSLPNPLPTSIDFAMRLIVAQYLRDTSVNTTAAQEFWDARNRLVHPAHPTGITIDGPVDDNIGSAIAEVAQLTGMPLHRTVSDWQHFILRSLKPKWASHAQAILQASHICDTFDFTRLSKGQSKALSINCGRLKKRRNPYAHPDWHKFQADLQIMLRHFGF